MLWCRAVDPLFVQQCMHLDRDMVNDRTLCWFGGEDLKQVRRLRGQGYKELEFEDVEFVELEIHESVSVCSARRNVQALFTGRFVQWSIGTNDDRGVRTRKRPTSKCRDHADRATARHEVSPFGPTPRA